MSTNSSKKAFLNKFELWTKFMQSGKTREMTKEIEKLAKTGDDYFHIIFCSNNLFLTAQTCHRVEDTYHKLNEEGKQRNEEKDELESFLNDVDYINESFTSPFLEQLQAIVLASSNSKCNCYDDLVKQFNDYRAILCCTNKMRLDNINQLLSEQFDDDQKVIIWIDEVHMNINAVLEKILKMSELDCVKQIIGITATPDNVFKNKEIKKSDTIKLKPMKACNSTIYYGYNDINKRIIDVDDYIIPDIIKNNRPNYECKKAVKQKDVDFIADKKVENALYLNTLLVNNEIKYTKHDVFYVPGVSYTKLHEAIRDVLLAHGFYVFIFNSNGSYLYKTVHDCIDIKEKMKERNSKCDMKIKTEHLGQLMGFIRKSEPLEDRAIGITGYLSIGQGNTLCDWDTDFYITKSVIGYESAKYARGGYHPFKTQVFGRCFGNLKHQERFKGTEVFMRSTFADDIEMSILSGALSHFSLKTGKRRMSWNDLQKTREEMKCMSFDDGANNEEKKENDKENDDDTNNEMDDTVDSSLSLNQLGLSFPPNIRCKYSNDPQHRCDKDHPLLAFSSINSLLAFLQSFNEVLSYEWTYYQYQYYDGFLCDDCDISFDDLNTVIYNCPICLFDRCDDCYNKNIDDSSYYPRNINLSPIISHKSSSFNHTHYVMLMIYYRQCLIDYLFRCYEC